MLIRQTNGGRVCSAGPALNKKQRGEVNGIPPMGDKSQKALNPANGIPPMGDESQKALNPANGIPPTGDESQKALNPANGISQKALNLYQLIKKHSLLATFLQIWFYFFCEVSEIIQIIQ